MILEMIGTEVRKADEAKSRGDTEGMERIHSDLAVIFKQIENNRKDVYRYGHNPALHEYNIMYKLIEGSAYHELFKQLISQYDDEVKCVIP
jgi:hypothetical protein